MELFPIHYFIVTQLLITVAHFKCKKILIIFLIVRNSCYGYCSINFYNCEFKNNFAGQTGGAMQISGGGSRDIKFVNSKIHNNTAFSNGDCGGGIRAYHVNLTVESSQIYGNACNGSAGQGGGLAINLNDFGTLFLVFL
jgi:hypothetical protein